MLRLELEAQVANAQAEVESIAADVAVERGRRIAPPVEDAAGSDADDTEAAATDEAVEPIAAPTAEASEPVPAPTADDESDDEAPPA
jgi:hypothetical protein